jgi:hypothetical protein
VVVDDPDDGPPPERRGLRNASIAEFPRSGDTVFDGYSTDSTA